MLTYLLTYLLTNPRSLAWLRQEEVALRVPHTIKSTSQGTAGKGKKKGALEGPRQRELAIKHIKRTLASVVNAI